MLINHVAVVNSDKEQARKFYGDFLEFEKTREYSVPPELSRQLFKLGGDMDIVVYERNDIRFEIFIKPDSVPATQEIRHTALFVDDLDAFLERARRFEVRHITGSIPGKTVHFITDYSGNMIEVKQKP